MFKKIINFFLIIIGGLLWRMGGSDEFPKWVRGIGVATLFTIIVGYNIFNSSFPFINILLAIFYAGITWVITWVLLSIGYGETSFIGKLFEFIDNQTLRDIAIRGTCAVCWSGAYLPSIYYRSDWWRIFYCLVPIVLMPLVRISKVDKLNPHIEEILMGAIYTLGIILVWSF